MSRIDVGYINPFIHATRHVFHTMLQVPVDLGKIHLRARPESAYSVSAELDITGPVAGKIALSFSTRAAVLLASALTGSAAKGLDADTLDAIGEVTSVIAGNAKKDLPGGLSSIGIPKVALQGSIEFPDNIPVIVIPCTTKTGNFMIEVALRPPATA